MKLKLYNVAFKKHTIGLRATLPCRCNLVINVRGRELSSQTAPVKDTDRD